MPFPKFRDMQTPGFKSKGLISVLFMRQSLMPNENIKLIKVR